jgi:hypothetical protein
LIRNIKSTFWRRTVLILAVGPLVIAGCAVAAWEGICEVAREIPPAVKDVWQGR